DNLKIVGDNKIILTKDQALTLVKKCTDLPKTPEVTFIASIAANQQVILQVCNVVKTENMEIESIQPNMIRFNSQGLSVCFFIELNQNPSIQIKVEYNSGSNVLRHLSEQELSILVAYFNSNVISYIPKNYLFVSYIRLFKFPPQVLLHITHIMHNEK
ncbi:MAG: hypothetical protein MHPSP_001018, partial [Paramarteilia canceri]